MFKRQIAGKAVLLSCFVFISSIVSMAMMPAVYADDPSVNVAPNGSVQITPSCADPASQSAVWQVNNTNSFAATVNWTAVDNGNTGSYSAPSGTSTLTTYYDGSDPNNTTNFVVDQDNTTQNATNAPCATPPTDPGSGGSGGGSTPTCIDGNTQQNLSYSFSDPGTVVVTTVGAQPVCSDVVLEFSAYIMPADYNGADFFGNSTAYPQVIVSTTSSTIFAGTSGPVTLHIALPASCNNVQTDLYYGPQIDTIGAAGTGPQNIVSGLLRSTGSCAAIGGGLGGGNLASASAIAAQTNLATTRVATNNLYGGTLTNTGAFPVLPTIVASLLIAGALAVSRQQLYRRAVADN